MRTAFTWLVLANLFAQQFVCCAESCASDPAPAELDAKSPCGHEGHNHDSGPSLPDGDPSSHHLCVATHLFYLRTDAGMGMPAAPILLSSFDLVSDALRGLPGRANVASHSVSPPPASRLRAALSVWTI